MLPFLSTSPVLKYFILVRSNDLRGRVLGEEKPRSHFLSESLVLSVSLHPFLTFAVSQCVTVFTVRFVGLPFLAVLGVSAIPIERDGRDLTSEAREREVRLRGADDEKELHVGLTKATCELCYFSNERTVNELRSDVLANARNECHR